MCLCVCGERKNYATQEDRTMSFFFFNQCTAHYSHESDKNPEQYDGYHKITRESMTAHVKELIAVTDK